MKQCVWLGVLLGATLTTGCVERRFVITSEPMGALVYRDGKPLTATPTDDHFVYYGKYHFTLVKDGYETLHHVQEVEAPWYQWLGFDFIAENLIPWTIHDVRRLHFQMVPVQKARPDQVLSQGLQLRARGQAIGTPPGFTVPIQAPAQPPGQVPAAPPPVLAPSGPVGTPFPVAPPEDGPLPRTLR